MNKKVISCILVLSMLLSFNTISNALNGNDEPDGYWMDADIYYSDNRTTVTIVPSGDDVTYWDPMSPYPHPIESDYSDESEYWLAVDQWVMQMRNIQNSYAGYDVKKFIVGSGFVSMEFALMDNFNIEEVVLPEGFENMWNSFANMGSLKKINIPQSIKQINLPACPELENIDIPENADIESIAMASCNKLRTIILPEKITKIEEGTFAYCPKLNNIYIPASVKSISKGQYADNAFCGCDSLTDVYYGGTEAQWKKYGLTQANSPELYDATIHYNSTRANAIAANNAANPTATPVATATATPVATATATPAATATATPVATATPQAGITATPIPNSTLISADIEKTVSAWGNDVYKLKIDISAAKMKEPSYVIVGVYEDNMLQAIQMVPIYPEVNGNSTEIEIGCNNDDTTMKIFLWDMKFKPHSAPWILPII